MANFIELREINKLIKEKFYIPAYQRGYRWDTQQVRDLLEDVYAFKNQANTQNGEFYCLQPIVVKRRDDDRYDVIDGQQRLTTIMIIQKYLEKRTYLIEYASREQSAEFLENISEYAIGAQETAEKYRNIDFYFMTNAFNVIHEWFDAMIEKNEEYSLPDEFSTYLLKYCKVIWYEVEDDADAESIFTRLNIGKIPLTNAELIKALFLRIGNFPEENDTAVLRQLEIANEWDSIETSLRDDKVWFFINPPNQAEYETRIEYIFDVIAGKKTGESENHTFCYFSERMDSQSIFDIWNEIKAHYRIIMEWYADSTLYHLIGFLTSSRIGTSLDELIKRYFENSFKKDEFKKYIVDLIQEYFIGIDLEELSYEDSRDQKYITDVLLLFNVVTVMNKRNAYSRFPFDSYNKDKWSLEHIHAQSAEGIGKSKEVWSAWIDEHLASFRQFSDEKYKDVVKLLENIDRERITGEQFNSVFDEISLTIQDDYGIDLHSIDNLALLNQSSNSAISNSFFDVKRKMIIARDREGLFIPVCTRNVFLKYYSEDPSQIHYWSATDRSDYLAAIRRVLADFVLEDSENE